MIVHFWTEPDSPENTLRFQGNSIWEGFVWKWRGGTRVWAVVRRTLPQWVVAVADDGGKRRVEVVLCFLRVVVCWWTHGGGVKLGGGNWIFGWYKTLTPCSFLVFQYGPMWFDILTFMAHALKHVHFCLTKSGYKTMKHK